MKRVNGEAAIGAAFLVCGFALAAAIVLRPAAPTPEQGARFVAESICARAKAQHRLIYPISRCIAAEMAHPEDNDR